MFVQRKARFIEVRNNQVYEAAVLLYLINKHFNIEMIIPQKKAVVYEQFFLVERIWSGEDKVDVRKFVNKRCDERIEFEISEGVSFKTARRRRNTNVFTETINMFVDFLREMGYFVETKVCGGKRVQFKEEYITAIFYGNDLIFGFDEIKRIGKELVGLYQEKTENAKVMVFEKNEFNLEKTDSIEGNHQTVTRKQQ
ncbi:hypothetical protein EIN_164330 [Entamoeba invadens IP1]|uniref:Uncharacterized protein n=1 Tax=Entamoeba invadens IP1 TaxID=370355 RepID=A0A0A1U471_ENTIV|nr:hypothetical protein EIN_164330 [Entamoeba invadens IP1]ELP89033.1 hypothetical protein EIN_164330 [Entamoeba invadens IP1]|eukprot:XP_004255804.1 hypothetical protein EIN_164330 [Entamoeba invadens IP1]